MSDSAIEIRSPSVRRWVASVSVVALVVEDIHGVINRLRGLPAELPQPLLIASMVLFACGCIAFLSWLWRAHKNLWVLGAGGIRVTAGWAVGWWFIPLANLFKPYLSMRELWWASDGSEQRSSGWLAAGSALPLIWWLSFLLYNVTFEGIDSYAVVTTVKVVTALAGMISATCILWIMRAVDVRQREMTTTNPEISTVTAPLLR